MSTFYDIHAEDFSKSRFSIWPHVKDFLDKLSPKSKVLDIGCGNGKNMAYRNDIQMYAKSGKITTTQDSSDLVLTLRDGNRYEESKNYESTSRKNKLSHLNYKQLQVNIPLEDYKLKHTNEELFKGNEEMLNVWQLDSVADSTIRIINKQITNLYGQAANYFYPRTLRFSNKINSFSNKK